MRFYIGQKVVCVDASQPRHLIGKDHLLTKGKIYTIVGTGFIHPLDPQMLPCVLLGEFPDHMPWAHRFRPVIERKTDISIFTRMLTPNKQRVEQSS